MALPSRTVVAAVAAATFGAAALPASAGPLGPPAAEPTEWDPGPEDGPPSVDGWPDGTWDTRLAGAYEGSTPNGTSELTADGAVSLVVDGGDLVAATPFQLGLFGPAEGLVGDLTGSADVAWVYAGDVAAGGGRVELRAASVTWTLENFEMDGQAVPFPGQTFDAANVFPLVVTSSTCGLVQGTWEGDAVQGMLQVGGGGAVIDEVTPRSFRAVSDAIDEEWLAEAEALGERIDAVDPLTTGALADLRDLVLDAEDLAARAGSDPCADEFSLGIGTQLEAALRALLEGREVGPDELWQVAELLARAGVQPGSAAHAAATTQLGRQVDLLVAGDVAGAVQLLQVALALGDSAAASRLLQRIGDPGGQLPGSWLPGL